MDLDMFIPIVLFIVFGFIVKLISDNKVRKMLIEKGQIDENVKFLFQSSGISNKNSSLKWGIVLVSVGLAVFIGQMFPHRIHDEMIIGLMLVFGGIALIVYYFLAKRYLNESDVEDAMVS